MKLILINEIMKSKKLNIENKVLESSIDQEVNNSSLFLDKSDSKSVQVLRRVEKYPNLPENEFIPLEYSDIDKNRYKINKKGEVLKLSDNKLLKGNKREGGYVVLKLSTYSNKRKNVTLSRLVAFIFLINPNYDIYSIVNHIDHNPNNNNLSNLEWVTAAWNNSRLDGISSYIDEKYLVNYIAIDDTGSELFRFNSRENNSNYDVGGINRSIRKKRKYKGYYWKRSINKSTNRNFLNFSGNLNDYEWFEHWKYPGLYVCREGFLRRNNNRVGYLKSNGYIFVTVSNSENIKRPVHRVLMEFILKRDLRKDEVVDHINTIKTDNSFKNLRLTDAKGNRNNKITLEKSSKKVILTDIFGDILLSDSMTNLSKFVYKTDRRRWIVKFNVVNDKYFCIFPNDKSDLLNKMQRIIYVFSEDKKKVIDAFTSIRSISRCEDSSIRVSIRKLKKLLNSGISSTEGKIYVRGYEAIKLLKSLGHINSLQDIELN